VRKLLSACNIWEIKNYRYANHSCNYSGNFGGFGFGTISQVLLDEDHPQYVGVPIIFCRNFEPDLTLTIRLPFPIAVFYNRPGHISIAGAL
jgi:hypothetical protein